MLFGTYCLAQHHHSSKEAVWPGKPQHWPRGPSSTGTWTPSFIQLNMTEVWGFFFKVEYKFVRNCLACLLCDH